MATEHHARNGRTEERPSPSNEIDYPIDSGVILYAKDFGDGSGQERVVSTRVDPVENGKGKETRPRRVVP